MKPILMLNLGGTICMSQTHTGLQPNSDVLPDFLNHHYPDVDYVYKEPFTLIDSSQADYHYWYDVAAYIQTHHNAYRGIIITHGTDSMAYFAASLRFYFKTLCLPIIITGSQIPLTHENSDAVSNIAYAIEHIDRPIMQKMHIAIAFNEQLLQAEKTSKVDTQSRNAFSQNCRGPVSKTSTLDQTISLRALNVKHIEIVWIHPAFNYQTLPDIQPNTIFIIKSYGAGNLPKHPLLETFFKRVQDKNGLVINHSQCFYSEINMDIYEAGHWLKQNNVLSAQNLVLEALLAKLQCIDSNQIATIRHNLLTPWHYELA